MIFEVTENQYFKLKLALSGAMFHRSHRGRFYVKAYGRRAIDCIKDMTI